ncbi:MAG: hypothetical protein C0467_31485 [Planctomycetaceae bacterium]|nr:hypothetical protein [Planctomycetaceae bacterium]
MAKKKPTAEPEKAGPTTPRQFRLGSDTLADLDLIAAHYSADKGVKATRSDAVRLSAKKEADRIRAEKGKLRK